MKNARRAASATLAGHTDKSDGFFSENLTAPGANLLIFSIRGVAPGSLAIRLKMALRGGTRRTTAVFWPNEANSPDLARPVNHRNNITYGKLGFV